MKNGFPTFDCTGNFASPGWSNKHWSQVVGANNFSFFFRAGSAAGASTPPSGRGFSRGRTFESNKSGDRLSRPAPLPPRLRTYSVGAGEACDPGVDPKSLQFAVKQVSIFKALNDVAVGHELRVLRDFANGKFEADRRSIMPSPRSAFASSSRFAASTAGKLWHHN